VENDLKWWWIEKFKLPPYHPLFTEKDIREHLIHYYEDCYRTYDLLNSLAENGEITPEQSRQLTALKDVVEEKKSKVYQKTKGFYNTADILPYNEAYNTGDPKLDAIETAIAEGKDKLAAKLLSEL